MTPATPHRLLSPHPAASPRTPRRPWTWIAAGLIAFSGVALAAPLPARIYVVGASAALPPGATRVAQLYQVPWATLGPGSEVIVSPGTYTGSGTINAQGTASRPVTLRPANPASPPVLTGGLDFDGAAWVQASGFVVRDTPYAAVAIRRGSHHITLQDSTLQRADMGVNISDGAGSGHRILRNRIESSVTHGIGVSVNSQAADRTLIADNLISASGHHGMEIHGSWYTVEGNTVSGSGRTLGGTSGIHFFNHSEDDGAGDHNVIRYNFTYGNRDRSHSDGNGIQLDRWSDHNTVAFNVSWRNDGAGIILFDAADNEVYCNTSFGNSLDPGGTHGDRAEIILNSTGLAIDRNSRNRVYDNIVVSTQPGVPAIHVDDTSKDNANLVGPNLYQHRAGGPLMRWGHSFLYSASEVDQYTARPGNLAEAPAFADESSPLNNGLRLLQPPSRPGKRVRGQADMLEAMPNTQTHFHGAYYTQPPAP